jgi:hypothetical protein
MTLRKSARRWWSFAALALVLAALPAIPARANLVLTVNANIAGQAGPQPIGTITATMSYNPAGAGFVETGSFAFQAPYNTLDNCYQFRWFQIITGIPDAFRTSDDVKFKDASGNYTRTPTVPFVDPPAGGYKYQQANGGADNDPFYENTDPGNYAYPNYSARHVQNVRVFTDDNPGPQDVYFQTYLVVSGGDIGANMFCVLAGYSWNTHLNAGGTLANPDPVQIANIDVKNLNTALGNSGFGAADKNLWTAKIDCTLMPCPEPSSVVLLSIAGVCLGLVYRGRRFGPAASSARAA